MRVLVRDLFDKDQTGREMYRIIEEYANDLNGIDVIISGKRKTFPDLSLLEAFDTIKLIPYKQDSAPVEIVARPKYINNETGADCKKKSILMSSYLKLNGIPYRLVAISNYPDKRVHHVFTQGLFSGQWMNLDPTYSSGVPFRSKQVTRFEVLK